jgi:hypothetical protein
MKGLELSQNRGIAIINSMEGIVLCEIAKQVLAPVPTANNSYISTRLPSQPYDVLISELPGSASGVKNKARLLGYISVIVAGVVGCYHHTIG